ncbi:MAG: hypothetical protein IJL59_01175 [Clostridia bacterium]|nr:hypothetical protein [Clostridia bacterium]
MIESEYIYIPHPPVNNKTFSEMSRKEALDFFSWFMENLDARIHNMCVFLQFNGNYDSASLYSLWKAVMRIYGKVSQNELSSAISCAGLYLAETFRHQYPHLTWECRLTGPKYGDKDMLVLAGFYEYSYHPPFPMYFEPENMIRVQASRLYDHTADEEQLYRLFKLWSKHASNE